MKNIVSMNPFECRMWSLHDRLESYINEESCREQIQSFDKHGQLIPALGRPLVGDPNHKVELIYGARRLFVARHINMPLLVELRDISDEQAIVAMDIENRHRTDISPYERGLSYTRWLRAGYFKSQEELAKALKVSSPQVSRLLKIAQLPAVIVGAFACPADILESWGLEIADGLADPERRRLTIAAARTIAADSRCPPAREVYRRLVTAHARGRRPSMGSHDQVVKDEHGVPQFRIRQQRNSIALVLPLAKVSAQTLASLRAATLRILQGSSDTVLISSSDTPPQARRSDTRDQPKHSSASN